MKPENDTLKPWHQQPNETAKQYAMFQFYLSLPLDQRTLVKVCEHFNFSQVYVGNIAGKWQWEARARAKANALADKVHQVQETAAAEIAFDWADWEMQNLDRVRGITEQILVRCEQMLALPVRESTKKDVPIFDAKTGKPVLDKDGKPVYQLVTIVKPVRFVAGDAPRYAEAAVILTKFLSETHRTGAPLSTILPPPPKPVEEMTVEEREAYIAELRAKQQQITRGELPQDLGGAD